MNCHRVQSLLSAYLDQEISSEERRLIRNHIFNCPDCAQCFEDLSRIKNCLGSLEPPSSQVDLIDHLLYYKLHVDHSFPSNPWMWGKRLTLTAACIFLFLLTSFYLFPVNSPNRMIAGQEVEFNVQDNFTPYQLVTEQSSSVNLFLGEEEEEKKNKKRDEFYFPEHKVLLHGIPVSLR